MNDAARSPWARRAKAIVAVALSSAVAGCAPSSPRAPRAPERRGGAPRAVTTVARAPQGGLRYRLHMGADATPERPDRIVVWMHPSGGSMNRFVEPLAPDFVRRGFALLVPIDKQVRVWKASEANQLLQRTLPDAARIPGIDATRPILMGFSAGGNMALDVWAEAPAQLGGVIVDCAGPWFLRGGRMFARPEPYPALSATPILLLIGEHDRGAAAWSDEAPAWISAGVPLTVRVVPDVGHVFLLRGEPLQDLYRWIEAR